MAAIHNESGLEVYTYPDDAAKAPEVVPHYFDTHKKKPSEYIHIVQQKKLPFGWSLWALLTLAAVISALVIGAGLGGGLGAKLAECKKYANNHPWWQARVPAHTFYFIRSEALSAPAETNACTTAGSGDENVSNDSDGYVPKLPKDISNLTQPSECAELGGPNEHTAISGLKFQFYCGMDAPWGADIKDRTALVAYTFSDCIEACAKMNEFVVRNNNGSRCDSLVFGWQMSKEWEAHEANCWLKSGTVAEKINFDQPEYIYAETPN